MTKMKRTCFSILTMAAMMLSAMPCLGRDVLKGHRTDSHPRAGLYAKTRVSDGVVARQAGLSNGIALKTADKKGSPIMRAEADELITQAPPGEIHVSQIRSSTSYFVEFGAAYLEDVEAMVGEFVVGDDGYIYIKDPFAYDATGTYMKARLNGNEAVLELPQLIDRDDVYEMGTEEDLFVARLKYDAAEDWYVMDEESQEIVFDYQDGVLSQREETDIMYGLVTADGEWLGYGDWNLVMQPVNETLAKMPNGIGAKEYTFSHSYGSSLVNVAFDGSDVYVSGINKDMPEACIVGKVAGNTVTFPAAQYLGISHHLIDMYTDEYQDYHAFFMPAVVEQEWNELYEDYIEVYYVIDELVFKFDSATGVMTADDVLLINASKTKTYYIEAFEGPCFRPYPGKKPAVPAKPVVTEYLPIDDHYNDGDIYGGITFVLFGMDVDGNYIDVHDLYYNIVVNDEIFTFTPDEFINLTEEMTDVPYDFADDFDFQVNDIYHNVYFTNPEYVKIGVQAKYVVDGVANVSEVAYYETSGVSEVDTEKEIVDIAYTDLLGKRVSHPSAGLYIKTLTYSDGSVKNIKVFVK